LTTHGSILKYIKIDKSGNEKKNEEKKEESEVAKREEKEG
jgi:hypothetical protein